MNSFWTCEDGICIYRNSFDPLIYIYLSRADKAWFTEAFDDRFVKLVDIMTTSELSDLHIL